MPDRIRPFVDADIWCRGLVSAVSVQRHSQDEYGGLD